MAKKIQHALIVTARKPNEEEYKGVGVILVDSFRKKFTEQQLNEMIETFRKDRGIAKDTVLGASFRRYYRLSKYPDMI